MKTEGKLKLYAVNLLSELQQIHETARFFCSNSTSASLLPPLVFTMDKASFLFYKATGRKEILHESPWDCLCQQQRIPSYGQSAAGRTEIISKRLCDGCSGGISMADDTCRQLLMLRKSFCARLASCITYVTGGPIIPVQHPLQGSCQCWDLCFQLMTQGQAHGGRVWTCGLSLGVCKDGSRALNVGQQGTAGGHTLD